MLDFTQPDFPAGEGDGTVDVCMLLTPPAGGMECDVVVELTLQSGKAGKSFETIFKSPHLKYLPSVFGEDLTPDDPALTLTFTAGAAPVMACETFNIDDDDNVECDHSATVLFGSVVDCAVDPPIVSASPSATVTIVDNDG